jgi:N-acetyl sugar amidotransferase
VASAVPQVGNQICARCIMDRSDPNITFDAQGVCNHCRRASELLARVRPSDVEAEAQLHQAAARIRRAGRANTYDCVIGVSGGVDSSYTALITKRMGLRALAVHFDNGWDSELAVQNIQRIVEALDMELETYVVDWAEFRDLQRSFLKASVIDFELPTDNAIVATMLKTAREHRIPYVLMGTNIATEHGIPAAWTWLKTDWTNIKAIQRAYGTMPLRSFPHVTTLDWGRVRVLGLGLKVLRPLNLINYRREAAVRELKSAVGWREYGAKHGESLITRFYQDYILPTKFGIDKRRAHLSDQIRNGEITRSAALEAIERAPYSPQELERESAYVLKKLGFAEGEFQAIMEDSPRPHTDFASDQWWAGILRKLVYPIGRI